MNPSRLCLRAFRSASRALGRKTKKKPSERINKKENSVCARMRFLISLVVGVVYGMKERNQCRGTIGEEEAEKKKRTTCKTRFEKIPLLQEGPKQLRVS